MTANINLHRYESYWWEALTRGKISGCAEYVLFAYLNVQQPINLSLSVFSLPHIPESLYFEPLESGLT